MTTKTLNPYHYICYRTVASGWQAVGYVTILADASSPADLMDFPGTAWAHDPEHKYTYGDIYPVPGDDTKRTTSAPVTSPIV